MKKSFKKMGLCLLSVGFIFHAASTIAFASKDEANLPSPEEKILTISHRGASGYAPEHTIPSYRLGEQMKGDYIEIDLQMTKDGSLIAMHDETVNRTTNGTGRVKDLTLKEIKQLDAGSWFNRQYPQNAKPEYEGLQVPTLEEIIQTFGKGSKYYIETKSPEVYPGMEEKLIETLKKYKLIGSNGRSSNVIIQSFSKESLQKVHHLSPTIPLVQLLSYSEPATITDEEIETIKTYAIGVGPSFSRIDKAYVQKIRSHHLHIHPYTVNTEEDMRKALEWGVTGVFTNYTDRFQKVIKEFKKAHE
ncbi:glycerophosphodiester phosphodiesterase [Heyndrickxia sp. NPDC080065]|uniref:glycerophosphodiester phosphodiesterase n=1 Tax=Heyndrickxia sp. NPDC080065 TaxID=3390568 RepID=UPI003D0693BD